MTRERRLAVFTGAGDATKMFCEDVGGTGRRERDIKMYSASSVCIDMRVDGVVLYSVVIARACCRGNALPGNSISRAILTYLACCYARTRMCVCVYR